MSTSHYKPALSTQMKQHARELRREQTDVEKSMWRLLRDRQLNGVKFRRQHVAGNYILDFYCHEMKLAIELDGGQHAEPAQLAYDAQRTQALAELDICVLRFLNSEVLMNAQGVLQIIAEAIEARQVDSPHPSPLPKGEGAGVNANGRSPGKGLNDLLRVE